ncbi:MAG: cytochrome c [Pseudomonas sp.]|nr:cytochrome c [Pseudomonas sp.]
MQKYVKLFLSAAALAFPYAGQAQKTESLVPDGPALYSKHCAKCHGKEGRANTLRGWFTSAQDLTDPKWQAETLDSDILDALEKGPRSMPSYANKLSIVEQNSLLKVIRDL